MISDVSLGHHGLVLLLPFAHDYVRDKFASMLLIRRALIRRPRYSWSA